MDTIKDIWFDANRIYMKTDGGETLAQRKFLVGKF